MTLQVAVATPFRQHGATVLDEHEFVVALSLDRDWFSPDQAKRLADVAVGDGLLERDGDDLAVTFDPADVPVPDDFVPDDGLLRERTAFERALDAVVEAGVEKREAVADINDLQRRLGVTAAAAAVVYARERGAEVATATEAARADLADDA